MAKVYSFLLASTFLINGQVMAQGESGRWTVQEVVSRNIIGVTQKYAEFKIGSPAITEKTDSLGIQRNLYQVGKCYVTLGIQNSVVVSVRMYASKGTCDLNLSDEYPFGKPGKMLTETTFEDWSRLGSLHFVDPGLPSCNACGEAGRFVYGLIDAVGANGMIEVQVGGGGSGNDAATKGYSAWRDILSDARIDGESLPISGKNCPLRQFDKQAFHLMKSTKITSIGYGRSNTMQPACSATTDQRLRGTGDFINP